MNAAIATAGKRLTPDEAEALWRAWRNGRDGGSRNKLILSYAPMVKYLASRKARALPAHCELDDLISCGLMALIAAIERFDPVKGATFEQYAWTRISGAIMDELRRQDWAPRSARRMERQAEEARERWIAREGRTPTEAELAGELQISTRDLRQRLADLDRADIVSLNAKVRSADDATMEVGETLESQQIDTDPELALLAQERGHVLREAIANLTERERDVLTLVHVHRVGGAEIGRMLGVSESRVSQILASARQRIRLYIAEYDRAADEAA